MTADKNSSESAKFIIRNPASEVHNQFSIFRISDKFHMGLIHALQQFSIRKS